MFGMGWQELALILVVALLLFGAKRLPEIGRSFGRAITSFKEGMKDGGENGKPKDPDPGQNA
ncbi:MAG: twin-arginine translocase TatA/TatE family subunit [Elusimicrobiota bacterium]|jgi:sec-independent protein translocase protein TatA